MILILCVFHLDLPPNPILSYRGIDTFENKHVYPPWVYFLSYPIEELIRKANSLVAVLSVLSFLSYPIEELILNVTIDFNVIVNTILSYRGIDTLYRTYIWLLRPITILSYRGIDTKLHLFASP